MLLTARLGCVQISDLFQARPNAFLAVRRTNVRKGKAMLHPQVTAAAATATPKNMLPTARSDCIRLSETAIPSDLVLPPPAMVMSRYHRTCRIVARFAVSGGWAAQYDERDLRDAVVYAAETHGEWGWGYGPDDVKGQLDEIEFVGYSEIDPYNYSDFGMYGPVEDSGWLRGIPSEEWAARLSDVFDRSFEHIIEAWLAKRLSPAILLEEIGEADGRGRAALAQAIGIPLKVATFRRKPK